MPQRSKWKIHPTAEVSEEAKLYGTGEISAGAIIEAGAELDRCKVGHDALILRRSFVDEGAVILPRARSFRKPELPPALPRIRFGRRGRDGVGSGKSAPPSSGNSGTRGHLS